MQPVFLASMYSGHKESQVLIAADVVYDLESATEILLNYSLNTFKL